MKNADLKESGRAPGKAIGRRELLVGAAPACALGCMGMALHPERLAAALARQEAPTSGQEPHKFDVQRDAKISRRQIATLENNNLIRLMETLRDELGQEEAIRILKEYSAGVGRRQGEQQREQMPDNSFATFTAQFRPPNYANALTHEVVEDTENAFGLRVTECVWASVFKNAEMDGEMGHAAVCNMDYHWPPAFNPKFRMERDKTLMQGHDQCNHRYIQEV